jgi:hypothetical protein
MSRRIRHRATMRSSSSRIMRRSEIDHSCFVGLFDNDVTTIRQREEREREREREREKNLDRIILKSN